MLRVRNNKCKWNRFDCFNLVFGYLKYPKILLDNKTVITDDNIRQK